MDSTGFESALSDTKQLIDDSGHDGEVEIKIVCQAIKQAAAEAMASEDYLSYATVLDIHLSDPDLYNYSQRELVLQALKDVLAEYPVLSREIGWDLPALILPYIQSSYDFRQDLVLAPCVHLVTEIFNLISHDGTPKELYLKGLEAMAQLKREPGHPSTCKDDQDNIELERYRREKFLGIKFHLLHKLVMASNGKITTQYPSRFLATTVTGLLSLLQNLVKSKSAFLILYVVLRRIYILVRDYVPNESPQPLDEKERVLIRAILRNTLTHAVGIASSDISIRWAIRNFREIQHGVFDQPLEQRRLVDDVDSAQSQMVDIMMRCSQLMLSIDMEPQNTFDYLVSLPFEAFEAQFGQFEESEEEDEANNEEDEEKYRPVSLSFDLNTPSLDGLLVLLMEHLYDEHPQNLTVSLDDWINLAIKYTMSRSRVPSIISDAIVFGSAYWFHLASTQKSAQDPLLFDSIPRDKLFHFLQVLTVFFVAVPPKPVIPDTTDNAPSFDELITPSCEATSTLVTFRRVILDLIAAVLRQRRAPDAWEWLLDSVSQCPWTFGRSQLIGVLKRLCMEDRTFSMKPIAEAVDPKAIESLAEAVKGTNLQDSQNAKITPPPLPPRVDKELLKPIPLKSTQKVIYSPSIGKPLAAHVSLDEEKIKLLVPIMVECAESTFIKDDEDDSTEVNGEELPVLLTWLNFLIGIVGKSNHELIVPVVTVIQQGLLNTRMSGVSTGSLQGHQLDLVSFTFDRLVSRIDEL